MPLLELTFSRREQCPLGDFWPTIRYVYPKPPWDLKTITMYHMHTCVAFKCMRMVHSGGFRFNGGFDYESHLFKILKPSYV